MRDNYVGDVGDFYKYRLLRELCGATGDRPKRKLGVVWYLYPDKCKETDGLHLSYLSPQKEAKYRPSDPELYDKLKQLVIDNDRSVAAVRRRGILPSETVFFEEPLSLSHLPKGNAAAKAVRLAHRDAWLAQALEATQDCDVIFFDPDNGLEVRSVAKHKDKGPKFVFYADLQQFWRRGQSLVIYQHRNMHQSAVTQIAERKLELKHHLSCHCDVDAFYFSKYGGRILFFVQQ